MIYLGIGSSIGNAEEIFDSAEKFLEERGILVTKKSRIYKNSPLGGVAKNQFSNAVWEVKADILPTKFLEILKSCEIVHGRDLGAKKWSDRPLDLDILMFDELILDTKNLKIPHPEIQNRDFVLKPWMEIVDEDFEIPNLGKLQNLISPSL